MASRHRVTLALLLGLACAACYKPNIQSGGLLCPDAGACPEGFFCAGDGHCREKMGEACKPDAARPVPLCTPEPGDDCDPICQSRCQCGGCTLVGSTFQCMPAGSKKRGDICNLENDDCEPGNVCFRDCGNKIGRCYRICGKGGVLNHAICEGGQRCGVTLTDRGGVATEYSLCEPPLEACNPLVDSGDCHDAALGCYLTPGGSPVCDCRGSMPPGDLCGPYNSCVPGYRCVEIFGEASCYKACRRNASDCTAPSTCTMLAGDSTFGYCP